MTSGFGLSISINGRKFPSLQAELDDIVDVVVFDVVVVVVVVLEPAEEDKIAWFMSRKSYKLSVRKTFIG